MRFASIDVGSNAVRLMLCHVYEVDGEAVLKKSELIRIPIRLGEDAFLHGKITKQKADKLVDTMKAFKLLIQVFDAVDYRACATSAMREASNGTEIIERIKREANVEIEIITGKFEAEVVYANHVVEHLDNNSSYLYVDVGGGSTELTLFSRGKWVTSKSFNIGTIRLLYNKIDKEYWQSFKDWIRENTKNYQPVIAIGSGGNINKIFKMLKKKESKPLNYENLRELHDNLQMLSYEERISQLGLSPDRADVIVPAAKIFMTIMKHATIDKIIVPQIGLSDGLIHLLYEKHKNFSVFNS
jgi:exopolyphosphatase / guanosine-5'-triphosphate,3'-diphosphate pyrophosphatase